MDKNGYIGRSPSDSSITIARQTNTAVGVQTTFVFNSGYDVGYLDVFLNGTKLINAIDYTATDTQNVSLETPTQSGDVLEFVAYKAFSVTSVITESDSLEVSGDVTASSVTVTNNVTAGSVEGTTITQNGVGIVTVGSDGSTLTGIVTTLVAGENISLSGSTGTVTVTGLAKTDIINADSLVVSGITTLSTLSGTTATFSGNVSVGGTLTYEDVANVDSVGVITARSGIRVGAGQSISPESGSITYYGDGTALTLDTQDLTIRSWLFTG